MGLMRRLLGEDRGPEWTGGMTGDEYRTFVDVVRTDLQARGRRFELGDGLVTFEGADGEGPLGLANIAQLCRQLPRHEWPDAVRTHFDRLFAAPKEMESATANFDAARPFLKVRIYGSDTLPGDAKLLRSPLAPGLEQILVLDLPAQVATVTPDTARDWAPIDELFEIARANLAAEPPPPRESVKGVRDVEVTVFMADSFFVASRVVMLPTLIDLSDAKGALVALPHRHALLVYPIRDIGVLPAVETMIRLAQRLYQEGPGSISPNLYWWHDGAMTHLPARAEGTRVHFFPPDAFVEVLNGLPAASS